MLVMRMLQFWLMMAQIIYIKKKILVCPCRKQFPKVEEDLNMG